MNRYVRKCDRCAKIIREEDNRAVWGREIVCSNCYDELLKGHFESAGVDPNFLRSGNPMTLNALVEKLEKEAKDHLDFSKGLWHSGDTVNAQYQNGLANGIRRAIQVLKENQEEHLKKVKGL
jgi:hypothetical protein